MAIGDGKAKKEAVEIKEELGFILDAVSSIGDKLINSFDVRFNISGNSLLLEVDNSAGYAIKVDEGVSAGTIVGLRKLQRWVKLKAKRGFLRASTKKAVYLIAKRVKKSIKERGTVSPKGFIENAMYTAQNAGVFNRIADATGLQVDSYLGETEIDSTITLTITA